MLQKLEFPLIKQLFNPLYTKDKDRVLLFEGKWEYEITSCLQNFETLTFLVFVPNFHKSIGLEQKYQIKITQSWDYWQLNLISHFLFFL